MTVVLPRTTLRTLLEVSSTNYLVTTSRAEERSPAVAQPGEKSRVPAARQAAVKTSAAAREHQSQEPDGAPRKKNC